MKELMIIMLSVNLLGCSRISCNDEKEIIKYFNSKLEIDNAYYWYSEFDNEFVLDTIPETRCKIISYFDAKNCMNCLDDLLLWSTTIEQDFKGVDVDYVFIVNTSPNEYRSHIHKYISSWNLPFSVFLDFNSSFQLSNKLSNKKFYHTFLLGEDNRIALVGNPLLSDELTVLYKEKIDLLTLGR